MHRDNVITIKTIRMDKNEVEGNWCEHKGRLKQKIASLTENDTLFAEGKKEELLGRLQIKLGKTKEELNRIITDL